MAGRDRSPPTLVTPWLLRKLALLEMMHGDDVCAQQINILTAIIYSWVLLGTCTLSTNVYLASSLLYHFYPNKGQGLYFFPLRLRVLTQLLFESAWINVYLISTLFPVYISLACVVNASQSRTHMCLLLFWKSILCKTKTWLVSECFVPTWPTNNHGKNQSLNSYNDSYSVT